MKHTDYIEKKRHGSSNFPIQYYYVDEKHHHYIMPAHWHKEFEIIRVLKGKFKVCLNSIEYNLYSGDILLVESGCLHRGEPSQSIYECIVFDLNMLTKQQNDITQKFIIPLSNSSAKINDIHIKSGSKTANIINNLFEVMRKKTSYYELKVYSLLFDCITELYTSKNISPANDSPQTHQAEAITSLIEWIENNLTEPITLQMLSEVSGFSKKYLCRIFKEYTSKTPITYINQLRIEKACSEMSTNNKSVTYAAFESGFNDLSYFCRTFKKYKKITPHEYKKRLNSDFIRK